MNCIKCHAELRPGAKFCPACGSSQQAGQAPTGPSCSHCQAPLKTGARFCGLCGAPVNQPEAPPPAELGTQASELTASTEQPQSFSGQVQAPAEAKQKLDAPQAAPEPVAQDQPASASPAPDRVQEEPGKPALAQWQKIPLIPLLGGAVSALVVIGAGAWLMFSHHLSSITPPTTQSAPEFAPLPFPPASLPQATPPVKAKKPAPTVVASEPTENTQREAENPAQSEPQTTPHPAPQAESHKEAAPAVKPQTKRKPSENSGKAEEEDAYIRQMNKQLEEQIRDLRKQQNH